MAINATTLGNQAALEIQSRKNISVSESELDATDSAGNSVQQETVSISSSETDQLTYSDPRKAQSGTDNTTTDGSTTDGTTTDGTTGGTTTSSTGGTDLASMIDASSQKVQQFIDMLGNMLKQQGLTWSKVVSGEQQLSADPKTIAAAKQAISPDGEFGIKNTADRILNFAKAAAGNDPSKLSALRDAIQQGFDSAAQYFGGNLPTISNQTHDLIMNTLDSWVKNGIPSGDVSVSDDDVAAVTNPKTNNASGSSGTTGSTSTDQSATGATISTSA